MSEMQTFSYTSLLIIAVLALVIPIALAKLERIRIPFVVGEIIAGIVIGHSGFNIIHGGQYLDFLRTFGLTYLMFLSGLEIDANLVFGRRAGHDAGEPAPWYTRPLLLAMVIFGLTLVGAYLVSMFLVRLGLIKAGLLMTLILSTTSLSVVMPVLKERQLTRTAYGQTVLITTLLADFATMVLLTVVIAVLTNGAVRDVMLVFVLLGAVPAIYPLANTFRQSRLIQRLAHATSELGVRFAFALILVFVALAQGLGVEVILGAFLAGVLMSFLLDEESKLTPKLDAIGYGFFLPIFFIMVGVNFDLESLFTNPRALQAVPVLVVASYVLKLLPALLFKLQYSWRQTLAGGTIISARLSMIIAAAAIAMRLGAITTAINSAVILVAIITCTVSPVIFDKLLPRQQEDDRRSVLIVGATRRAALLAQRLLEHQEQVILLDNDPAKTVEREQTGHVTGIKRRHGDATQRQVLEEAGTAQCQVAVITTGNDEVNLEIGRRVREWFPVQQVLVVATSGESLAEGVSSRLQVINPELAAIVLLDNLVRHPETYRLISDEANIHFGELEVTDPSLAGQLVRDLSLPGNMLIVSIARAGERVVPHGNTTLHKGDVLTYLGTEEELDEFELFHGRNNKVYTL